MHGRWSTRQVDPQYCPSRPVPAQTLRKWIQNFEKANPMTIDRGHDDYPGLSKSHEAQIQLSL
jgi:hypothetical protein